MGKYKCVCVSVYGIDVTLLVFLFWIFRFGIFTPREVISYTYTDIYHRHIKSIGLHYSKLNTFKFLDKYDVSQVRNSYRRRIR